MIESNQHFLKFSATLKLNRQLLIIITESDDGQKRFRDD